jgi:sodium pump decarboxylase gamma subunit
MLILTADWATVFEIAGMGIGVVFVILILLVFVLQIFSAVAEKTTKAVKHSATAVKTVVKKPVSPEEEEESAAVAAAVFLYVSNSHDRDSGVLTIKQQEAGHWHEELNERL